MLPNGQVLYTAAAAPSSTSTRRTARPTRCGVPTITGCPSSVRRGRTYTLSRPPDQRASRSASTTAMTPPRPPTIRSSGSSRRHRPTSTTAARPAFSTMGLQTGTMIHSCRFTVPARCRSAATACASSPTASARRPARTVGVTNKWFKELKHEIKEKLEIIENLKQIRDLNVKRLPDIVDIKADPRRHRLRHLRADPGGVGEERADPRRRASTRPTRSSAGPSSRPDERPLVGPPPPIIEEMNVPRDLRRPRPGAARRSARSSTGARSSRSRSEAEELHNVIHALALRAGQAGGRREGA